MSRSAPWNSHIAHQRSVSDQRTNFHAYYQDEVAVIGLDPVDLIAGSLPRRQRRLVEAWAELHQEELVTDWARLQAGQAPLPIAPLE